MGKRGTYKRKTEHTLLPIDYALLEILPDEGQMIGFKPIAMKVESIKERPGFEDLSGNQISGRLKSMSMYGLTVSQVTLPIAGGLGWQRTLAGRKALESNGRVAT